MIGSLLFVGMPIRRDRDATATETINRRQTGARELLMSVATAPDLARIMAKVSEGKLLGPVEALAREFDLDSEEAIRLDFYFVTLARQAASFLKLPLSDTERADLERSSRYADPQRRL
jgi:hypothetical protein